MNRIDPKHPASHEQDFALWTAEQAALLRAGKLDRVDLENVAEEIESLGRSEKQEIRSRLTIVLIHLLKWAFQPDGRSASWASSITIGRIEVQRIVEDSPSLRAYPGDVLDRAYAHGPRVAALETGLPEATFPEHCPWSVEQVLDLDFWPGETR